MWFEKVADSIHAQPIGLSLGFSVYRKKVAPEHPRYCIQCAKAQTEEYGYPYFRREHQLHWVNVCWKHGTVLSHGCSICGPYPIKKAGLSLPGRCLCADGASYLAAASVDGNDREHYKWLAVQSAYMVNSNGMPFENIRTTLKAMCIEKNISRGPLLDRRSLADELTADLVTAFCTISVIRLGTIPSLAPGYPACLIPANHIQEENRSSSTCLSLVRCSTPLPSLKAILLKNLSPSIMPNC